jgi:hypothetical protein
MRTDTERVIQEFGIKTLGNVKNIEKLEAKLHDNEEVIYISPTNVVISEANTRAVKKLPGVCALTNERFIFYNKTLFNEYTDMVPIDEIRSLDCSGNGLTGGHIKISSITKTYDILVTYKKEVMASIQEKFYSVKNSPRNQVTNSPDIIDQIQKLSDLKDKGVLTEEEFNQKKTELLSKL